MGEKSDNHLNKFQGNGSYNGLHYNGHEPVPDEDEINIQQLFYRLWRNKWVIAGAITLCVILAGLAALLKTPIYRSEGSLMITQPQNRYSYTGSGLADLLSTTYGIGQTSTLENELLILQSQSLARELADSLMGIRIMGNGRQFPILFTEYPQDSMMAPMDNIVERLRNRLIFNRVSREADMIKIAYESPSALEAAVIVNMTMDIYAQISMDQNRRAASAAVQFLDEERQRIKEDLQSAENRLRVFRDEENMVEISEQTKTLITRMAELEAQKQGARVKLVAVNSGIQQFEERLNNIRPGLSDQLSKAVGPELERLQYKLADLKIEKQLLLSNYPELKNIATPPRELQALNEDIAFFKNQISELTVDLVENNNQYAGMVLGTDNIAQNIGQITEKLIGLKVEKQQYQAQIETINEQLAGSEQFFQSLPGNMTSLARLTRQVKINEQLFMTVSQQYAEMALWQQTQFGLGRIIDNAFVNETPVEPRTKLFLVIGFVLGCILGVGYVFTREAFNTVVNSVNSLKAMDVPLLTLVPDMNNYIQKEHGGKEEITVQNAAISSRLITAYDTNSPVAESFRRLESNIIHSNPDTDLKTLMVTSTTKGEGKTTVIANLGVILAESEKKVLLVETDLRRPHIHNMFGLNKSPGIMDILFENTSRYDAVHRTIVPNLHLLPIGYIPPNPAAVTKSSAYLNLIQSLGDHYDYILLDTAPYGIISDASSLIKLSDGIIVTVEFNSTHIAQFNNTIDGLQNINANVLGTVVTRFDYAKSREYDYGNGYYKYAYEDYEAYQQQG